MKYIQTSSEEQTKNKNKTNIQTNKASFLSTFLHVFNNTMQEK
jgi:hypothetical protein